MKFTEDLKKAKFTDYDYYKYNTVNTIFMYHMINK